MVANWFWIFFILPKRNTCMGVIKCCFLVFRVYFFNSIFLHNSFTYWWYRLVIFIKQMFWGFFKKWKPDVMLDYTFYAKILFLWMVLVFTLEKWCIFCFVMFNLMSTSFTFNLWRILFITQVRLDSNQIFHTFLNWTF